MEDANGVGKKKKKRRTEIKKIADKNARNVTFTKRRTGLFRRVDTLSRRFRFDYFVVVFSPVGRAYSAGNPSLLRSFLPRRSPAPTAADAGGGASSSSAPARALPSPDASDAAGGEEERPPQEIIKLQAASTSSSAHVEPDGVEGEKLRRRYIHGLMRLRERVADRIEFLTGTSVDNVTTFRHYI